MVAPDTIIPIEAQIAAIRIEVAKRPALLPYYDTFVAKLPKARLSELIVKHGPSRGMQGQNKYLDCPFWIYQKLILAQRLGLINTTGMRILDIGMGGGHFSFVLNNLGHQVVGIDIENPIYDDICRALGVVRRTRAVQLGRSLLDSEERFDLITGFAAQFFNTAGGQTWTTDEWINFLRAVILMHIKVPGRIYFSLNRIPAQSAHLVDMAKVAGTFSGVFTDQGSILDILVAAPSGSACGLQALP